MKKEVIGVCEVCGNVEIRPSPCNIAVCQKCYSNPHLVTEVRLKSPAEVMKGIETAKHPTFKFLMRKVGVK